MDVKLLLSSKSTREVKTGTWSIAKPVFINSLAPCMDACPLKIDAPLLVEIIEQDIKRAAEALLKFNPFAFITGRVCPAFCKEKCNRSKLDEPVSIREIERFLGDVIISEGIIPPRANERRERIAVIGSGPAGMSAAWYGAINGFKVTVFEEESEPGGILSWGIPPFRLSKDLIRVAVKRLEMLGVRIITGRRIENLKDLKNTFDHIIVATGLKKARRLYFPGWERTFTGLEVLREYNLKGIVPESKEVVVIGGGNVAVDVALVFLREGRRVSMVCVEPKEKMPSIKEEIEEAIKNGLRLIPSTTVERVEKKAEGIRVHLREAEIVGEKDRLKEVKAGKYIGSIEADVVIVAVGQEKDISFEGYTEMAGDYATGPSSVAQAIASGRDAIYRIMGIEPYRPARDRNNIVTFDMLNTDHIQTMPSKRCVNDEGELIEEARRCISCGYCNSCGNCWTFCPDIAILPDASGKPTLQSDYCKGCGICQEECPRGVVSIHPV